MEISVVKVKTDSGQKKQNIFITNKVGTILSEHVMIIYIMTNEILQNRSFSFSNS